MIFRAEIARKIARGEKTMVRRPVNGRTTDQFGLCRVKVGRRYPVEYAEESQVSSADRKVRQVNHLAWLVVTEVRRERLGDVNAEDAAREGFVRKGFGQVDLFRQDWVEHHGQFVAELEVWVIAFDVEPEMPMYLTSGVIGPPHGDYTTNPRRTSDGAEVVDAAFASRYANEAKRADALREQRRRDEWDLMEEYRRAKADADQLGLDTSHHDRVIKDRIARIRRGVQGKAA
jgi:hypothetical protein